MITKIKIPKEYLSYFTTKKCYIYSASRHALLLLNEEDNSEYKKRISEDLNRTDISKKFAIAKSSVSIIRDNYIEIADEKLTRFIRGLDDEDKMNPVFELRTTKYGLRELRVTFPNRDEELF